MAFGKSHNKPEYSISTSVSPRKGKYVKGPSFGLWLADNGPMARGSVKEDYLNELVSFLRKAASEDMSVAFALFKNDNKKSKRRDDDDDNEEEYGSKRRSKDEDDEPPAKKKRRPEPEEEEEEAPPKKKKPVEEEEEEAPAKKSKKKSDWDFD